MRKTYDQITTTIKRQWLAQIVAGTKKIECRQIKPRCASCEAQMERSHLKFKDKPLTAP